MSSTGSPGRAASGEPEVITVSAVTLVGDDGRWVAVRKCGTGRYMHPGGKPEPGESARRCAVREVYEELGLELDPGAIGDLGWVECQAANEPGALLRAAVFEAACPGRPQPRAEIEEMRWVDPAELAELDESDCAPWAPLLVRVARLRGARRPS